MANIKRKRKNKKPTDRNGKAHGEWVSYHGNGKLHHRWNYVHGVPHGFFEGYNDNGVIWYYGYRNMDIKINYWYWFGEKRYYLWLI